MPNGLQKSLFCRMSGMANFTLSGCINRSRSMWVDPAGPQYCGYAAYGVQNDPKTGGPEGAGAAAGPACAGCRCRRRSRVVREGAVNGLVCPNCPDRSTNVTRHCKYRDHTAVYVQGLPHNVQRQDGNRPALQADQHRDLDDGCLDVYLCGPLNGISIHYISESIGRTYRYTDSSRNAE